MQFRSSPILAALAAIGAASPAIGATTIVVPITGAQEPTPLFPTLSNSTTPRPQAFGTGTFVLNDALTALTYSISVFNIDFTGSQTADTFDNLLAAHIHAGTTLSGSGTFPVVFGFIGTPFNETNTNDVVVTPFANGVGGNVSGKWDVGEGNGTTLTAQLPNLLASRAYVNFHTVQFPGGEIRGNFPGVPEPATWAMMLIGFGAVGGAMRSAKRRQKVTVSYA
jgi:hypothetical protein